MIYKYIINTYQKQARRKGREGGTEEEREGETKGNE